MDLLTLIVLFGTLGGLGGLAALFTALFSRRKLRAEGDTFVVHAADSLTAIAMRQLDRLERDVRKEMDASATLRARVTKLETEIDELMDERRKLRAENTRLRARVKALEEEVASLKGNQKGNQ